MSDSAPPSTDQSIDPMAADALQRLVRIVHRCGVPADQIEKLVSRAVRELPRIEAREPLAQDRELPSVPHVLTLWHCDPAYIDKKGEPLPLKLRGRRISFEALVQKVDSSLDCEHVLQYLMRANAVKADGARYRAIQRAVILRGISGPRDFRHLRSVGAMLRTTEHNLLPPDEAPGWLERMAENDHVPESRLHAFGEFLRELTDGYLGDIDEWLLTASSEGTPGEPVCKVTVGMYRSQTESPKSGEGS
ncbi:MAG: DUF6502 family protein [Gammaproteobacteria bacterium]